MAASSKGGQKANKTASGVRCTHTASGAVGKCTEHRQQSKNKIEAFRRMAEDPRFKAWHKVEVARHMGTLKSIEKKVNQMMSNDNIKVEVQINDQWVEGESI
jgi:protein subunit release factor B